MISAHHCVFTHSHNLTMTRNNLRRRRIVQLSISTTLLVIALTLPHPPCATAQTDSPPPQPRPKRIFNSKINLTPSMAIIIACLIGSFFLMGCFSIFLTRHCIDRHLTLESHGISAPNRHRRRRFRYLIPRGLDPSIIDTFPTFVYSEVKGLKTNGVSLECAVCLNEFENTDTLRLLPECCHVFHPNCIDAWLSTHVTCPVCRSNLTLLIHDPKPELESADSVGVNDLFVPVQSPVSISAVRSTSMKERMRTGGKLWRWYAVVQEGENCDKFTLRLPEEARSRLVNSASFSRTKSCVSFERVSSSRKGYRSGSGGISKLRFMATPPQKVVVMGGCEAVTGKPSALSKPVRVPLRQLIWGRESNEEERVNDGERSFNRLILDDRRCHDFT